MMQFTRRSFLVGSVAAVAGRAKPAASAPAGPVSIGKCASYDEDLVGKLSTLFDQLGGIGKLVRGKTVTVKLNLTGSPNSRLSGHAPGVTHWVHPNLVLACCHLLGKAGAIRIRLVESGAVPADSLEDYVMGGGWDVQAICSAARGVAFERTNGLGDAKRYVRFKVPYGGYIYPGYDLHPAYHDTDVFFTMAKLKNHVTCGVTLSLKNSFGITPNSIYGSDAGVDEPNERARQGRQQVFHYGARQPSKSAPQEINPRSSRADTYRVPRIVTDLVAARPIDVQIIDGIESCVGGEGPWCKGVRYAKPGVLIAGLNPVSTDAVSMAVMGYDPRADRGTKPFQVCDSTLKLAEAVGIGTTDLNRIDVRGVSIANALFDFEAHKNG